MGTRGAIGWRIDGEDHATYNHFDSYPSHLGVQFIKDAQAMLATEDDEETYKQKVRSVQWVKEDATPTPAERQVYMAMGVANVDVSTGSDWYSTLRELQGELKKNIDLGVMIESTAFLKDSLFCEWAYLINFDDRVLEFYQGFNQNAQAPGRFAAFGEPENEGDRDNGYRGVALIATLPFDKVVSTNVPPGHIADWVNAFGWTAEDLESEPEMAATYRAGVEAQLLEIASNPPGVAYAILAVEPEPPTAA